MRCLICGRAAERGEHERDIRRLTGWLLAVVFMLGWFAGIVCACVAVMGWAIL